MVTSRAAYGHVPDPIRLWDAAVQLDADSEQCAAAEIVERMRKNRAADERLVFFTLGSSPQASAGDDGNVSEVDAHDERLHEVMLEDRERVFWNRSEVVAALLKCDRDFIPPRYATPDALFRALSTWPLDHWSIFSRHMFWDQLSITLADLSGWLSRAEQSMPRFLVGERPFKQPLDGTSGHSTIEADASAASAPGKIGSETACTRWLEGLMRAGDREQPKPKYQAEAQKKFPGLSGQGFKRAWAAAIEATGKVSWSKRGRLR